MSSYWGERLHVSIYGESHGQGIGVTIDNLPAGQVIDWDEIKAFMKRRAPGQGPHTTPRKEMDLPIVLSGVYRNKTCGTPLAILIKNQDTRSQDYAELELVPRPGHADYTGNIRYRGANDPRGGGHFSGRLTAPITFAGALCLQILKRQGIEIHAHIKEIAGITDTPIDFANPPKEELAQAGQKNLATLSSEKAYLMQEAIETARMKQDSVGGIVELVAFGLPAGLGDPMFGGLEPKLASFLYAIPAVKALSFGRGFDACRSTGSANNDSPEYCGGKEGKHVTFRTNNGGGIDGGISNGMPLILQVGVKPTASISQPQQSVDLMAMKNTELVVKGRHDPCIVPRVVPVIEAAVAVVLLDSLLQSGRFDFTKTGELPVTIQSQDSELLTEPYESYRLEE